MSKCHIVGNHLQRLKSEDNNKSMKYYRACKELIEFPVLQVVCGNCSDCKAQLRYLKYKEGRVCEECFKILSQGN